MQFVSVNLDLDEVSIVRQALSRSMATCVCSAIDDGTRCKSCAACEFLIAELERVIQRANCGARRAMPAAALLAFAGDRREIGDELAPALPLGLRVMRGGLADD
ncbi:MAG TPA: hypothetical protein VFQ80_00930 [Thermomicrobiales bacterium]|nr:hypothetical protein [Thermomicrobiales bacterium]